MTGRPTHSPRGVPYWRPDRGQPVDFERSGRPIPCHYEGIGLPPISRWILERREAAGLTQQHLAYLCGVAQTLVSRWENGIRIPHDRHQDALRRVLGRDIPMDGLSCQR